MACNTLGLRDLRLARGLTLEEEAALSECSVTLISRLERGLATLSPAIAQQLGDVLGVCPAELIAEQERRHRQACAELRTRLETAGAER